jgi:hypothetical protein
MTAPRPEEGGAVSHAAEQEGRLRDGSRVVVRPISPEDKGVGAQLAQLLRAAASGVAKFVARRTAADVPRAPQGRR